MTKLLTLKNVKQFALILAGMALALALFQFAEPIVSAQSTMIDPNDSPGNIQDSTNSEDSFRTLARTIINFFLFFLGFIATVMIIYGGAMYVTAGGAQEKVDSAKKIITYAVIGIIIILLSFAITNTVLESGLGVEQPA